MYIFTKEIFTLNTINGNISNENTRIHAVNNMIVAMLITLPCDVN